MEWCTLGIQERIKIEYRDITAEQFQEKMQGFNKNLYDLFEKSRELEIEIKEKLSGLEYE